MIHSGMQITLALWQVNILSLLFTCEIILLLRVHMDVTTA